MKEVLKSVLKDNTQLSFAWIAFLLGIFLSIFGFLTPPVGIIDNSVLVAIGEFLAFAGALVGLHTKYSFEITELKKKLNGNN